MTASVSPAARSRIRSGHTGVRIAVDLLGLATVALGVAGSAVLGGILVAGGIIAMAWPGITLWTVAVVTGVSLLAHGIGRLGLALAARREVAGRPWLALAGAFGILCGVLALAWPAATVLVLCIVLGAQVTAPGVLLLIAAFLPYGSAARAPAAA